MADDRNLDTSYRKRKRTGSSAIAMPELPCSDGETSSSERYTICRDPTYYYEDGSCILLIEDTLFNVHKSILSRDNSSFSTLFTLPQGTHEAEGQSDDNPIVLSGDKPDEFRHFLWALYALPPELQIVNSPSADLTKLIDIARISNKYSFKSLETWALDAVQEYVNRRPSHHPPSSSFFTGNVGDNNALTSASAAASTTTPTQTHLALIENTDQLTRLIQLAQLCHHDRLLNSMIALLRQLMSRSLHYAYLSMALADDLNLRTLRGAAYLEVMQRGQFTGTRGGRKRQQQIGNGEGNSDTSLTAPSTPLPITPSQQLRLLSGYFHLTRTWERLRSTPPVFAHAPSCSATWHQPGCTQAWVEFWKDKTKGEGVMGLGIADVIGRLKMVMKDYDRGGPTYMAHDCKLAARRSLMDCIKAVEERLPDYFSDEGLDEEEF